MLSMSRGILRRVAQQLFRDHARVLEFHLRARLIALEQMNRSLEEGFWHRCCRVRNQCLTRKFLHDRASGNLRCNMRSQVCAQVSNPFGSVPTGIEGNCCSTAVRSPFHTASRYPLNATVSNELGATAIARSTVLSAASKLRNAI